MGNWATGTSAVLLELLVTFDGEGNVTHVECDYRIKLPDGSLLLEQALRHVSIDNPAADQLATTVYPEIVTTLLGWIQAVEGL